MTLLKCSNSFVGFLTLVFVFGCSKQSQAPAEQAQRQSEHELQKAVEPSSVQALEGYFKNESSLHKSGWVFYAAQAKGSEIFVYLIFP